MPSQHRAGVRQQRAAKGRHLLEQAQTNSWKEHIRHTFIHFAEDLQAKAQAALERSATCPQNFAPAASVIAKARRPQSPTPAFDASDWTEAGSVGLGGRRPLLGGSLRLILAQKEAAAAAAAAAAAGGAAASGSCAAASPMGAPGAGKRSNARPAPRTIPPPSHIAARAAATASSGSRANTAAAAAEKQEQQKDAGLEAASLAPCADEVEDDSTEAATGTSLAGSEEESESRASREQTRSPSGPSSKGSSGVVEDDGWTQVPCRKKGAGGSRREMPASEALAAAANVAEVAEGCGDDARSGQDADQADMDALRQAEQELLLPPEFQEQPEDEQWEQQRDRRDRRQKQRRQAQQVENAPAAAAIEEAGLEAAASSSSAYRHGDYSGYEAGNSWWNRSSWGDGAWPKRSVVRYEVGIPQCEEYNVMRRLLVPSGGHMRRVAEHTGAKLCVRGKGSGHLEGVEKKEAPEPLMVCITSSPTADVPKACQMVEELLRELQTEYGEIKRKRGEPVPEIRIARI